MSWPSSAREGRDPWIDGLRRELLGRRDTEARMGAFAIVLDAPLLDLAARIVERNEDVFIQAFLAKARIEAYMDPARAQGCKSADENPVAVC